jgi:hypothetical protein
MRILSKKTTSLVLGILLLFLLIFTNGVPNIQSDGFGSFHTTQCLIKENSWACKHRPEYYPEASAHTVSYYKNQYVTVYAPGSALFNLPGQIIANQLDRSKTEDDSFKSRYGVSMIEGTFFLITALIVSILSLILIYKALVNFKFTKRTALISTATAYLSLYAIWYVLLNHGFNHTYEIFALSIILYIYSKISKPMKPRALMRLNIALGAAIGLAVITRPTLGIVGLFIAIFLILRKKYKFIPHIILGGLPFMIMWFSYNYTSYGKIIASGYTVLFDQTFQFGEWNGLNILISQYRGWFVYSPLAIIACVGLIFAARKVRKNRFTDIQIMAGVGLGSIISTVILYGFWPIWWGGGSFGQRFLISFLPFIALGTAIVISKKDVFNKKGVTLLGATILLFTAWSLLITALYRVTPVMELRPANDYDGEMTSVDRYTPFDMIKYQVNTLTESDSVSDYGQSVFNSIDGGIPYVAFFFGITKYTANVETIDGDIYFRLIKPANSKLSPAETTTIYIKDLETNTIYSKTIKLSNESQLIFIIDPLDIDANELNGSLELDYSETKKFKYGEIEIYLTEIENVTVVGKPAPRDISVEQRGVYTLKD